jgi:uncharacterized membrane protein YhhN
MSFRQRVSLACIKYYLLIIALLMAGPHLSTATEHTVAFFIIVLVPMACAGLEEWNE